MREMSIERPREHYNEMLQGVTLAISTIFGIEEGNEQGVFVNKQFSKDKFGEHFESVKEVALFFGASKFFNRGAAYVHFEQDKLPKEHELRALGHALANKLWDLQHIPILRLALQRLVTVFPTALDPRLDAARGIARTDKDVQLELKENSWFLCAASERYFSEQYNSGKYRWVNDYFVLKLNDIMALFPLRTFRAPNGQVILKGMLFTPSGKQRTELLGRYIVSGVTGNKQIARDGLVLKPIRSVDYTPTWTQSRRAEGKFKRKLEDAQIPTHP